MERLRGFRDIYPEDAEPRKKIFNVAERMSEIFDFSKIEFPSVESMDLYRLKSGEELVGQTFSFTDKGGREVTLTPEATPSVVRMLTARKDLQLPVKWYSFQRYWRYEEPQSGRQREFFQYNADIFGVDSIESDAEIIGLACRILDELGLEGKYSMKLNSRDFMESLLVSKGISELDRAYAIIDKAKKTAPEKTISDLEGIGLDPDSAKNLVSMFEVEYEPDSFPIDSFSYMGSDIEKLERLVETTKLVSSYTPSRVTIDLSIVRGLTYYTGVVFEAYDNDGSFRSILGGGRYDRLASLMSEQEIPAIGFGMGDVILELMLKKSDIKSPVSEDKSVYVCYSDPNLFGYSLSIANEFRKQSFRTAINMTARSLTAQIRQASKRGFRYAVIIGEKEYGSGNMTLKDMTSGKQIEITNKEIGNLQNLF